MFDLQDKVAIVTGAGSGIGAAIAKLFGTQGAHVIALDLVEAGARGTAEAVRAAGGRASWHACDVSDATVVDALVGRIATEHARIDILVNNAGISHIGALDTTSPEDFDRLFRVNVRGVFLCARAVIPIMLRQSSG